MPRSRRKSLLPVGLSAFLVLLLFPMQRVFAGFLILGLACCWCGVADAQTPQPAVINIGPVPHAGSLPYGIARVHANPTFGDIETYYVVDLFSGQTWIYDELLDNIGVIPSPGGAGAGITWDPTTNSLFWVDNVAETLIETDLLGGILNVFPMASPANGLFRGIAMDWVNDTIWANDFKADIYYEFSKTAVPTGNSFPHPDGFGFGDGIAYRSLDSVGNPDNLDFEIPHGAPPAFQVTTITKIVAATGLPDPDPAYSPIDVSSLGGWITGIEWNPASAVSGNVAIMVLEAGSNTLYEIAARPKGSHPFVRGDINDDGMVNIADAVFLLNFLFTPGSSPPPCETSADVNRSCTVNVADPVYLLAFLFSPGSPPPTAPFPDCGNTVDCPNLTCVIFTNCP